MVNLWLIMVNNGESMDNISMIPSGNLLHNYGKIHHFLMGKLTISMAIFNSYVKLPEGMRLCMFMYVYVNHIQSSAVDLLVLRVLFSK